MPKGPLPNRNVTDREHFINLPLAAGCGELQNEDFLNVPVEIQPQKF